MKVDILGTKVDNLTKRQVLDTIAERLRDGKSTFIVTPYSESIVAAQKDAEFRNVLNSADIVLPDGVGIPWAAKFLSLPPPQAWGGLGRGRTVAIAWNLIKSLAAIIFNPSYIRNPILEKISGSDFIWDLAKLAAENNYSIFLLGGFGDTAERAGKTLKQKFPNLNIAGTASPLPNPPPQGEGNTKQNSLPLEGGGKGGGELVEQINSSGADLLFVALGPVRQEKWIYQNLPDLRVKLAIGLGGTFDYLARKRPYRPKFWATRGLEWLWRLLTQPRRAGRIFRGVWGLIWYSFKYKLNK